MYFTKNHYEKVIKIIRSNNDRLLKEASVTPGGLKKTIINLTSLLSKRIGKKFIGNPDVVFNVSKTSGNYSGVKYYMPDGSAIRFNWKMGSSATLDSVDFFNKKQVMPIYTFDGLEGFNLNQILEVLTSYLKSGQTIISLEEQSLKEFKVSNLLVKFKKAEKEEPVDNGEGKAQVMKIKALSANQIFEKIERDLRFILNPSSGENLMIISGDPGVGKTVIAKKVLSEIGGKASRPSLHVLPPVNSKRMKDLLAREGSTDTQGNKIAKSVQAKMKELSETEVPFEPKWVLGSQSIKGITLYSEMYQSNGKVLLYDDADKVFSIEENKQLLKQAMDDKIYRPIKWSSKVPYVNLGADVGIIPKEFIYSGKLIIITNKTSGQIDDAIKSRARFIDVDLTPKQFMERLETLIPEIQRNEIPYISLDYFQIVYDWLYDIFVNKKILNKFDIRTFKEIVKELFILEGNRSLWETIAAIQIKTKYPTAGFQIG